MCALTPELIKKENMVFPHEMDAQVSTEPHFQRIWNIYRIHTLKGKVTAAVNAGSVSQEDADAACAFLSKGAGSKQMMISGYCQGKIGRPDLANDAGFLATDRVFNAVGLGGAKFNMVTAEGYESQFARAFDKTFNLNEIEMKE